MQYYCKIKRNEMRFTSKVAKKRSKTNNFYDNKKLLKTSKKNSPKNKLHSHRINLEKTLENEINVE